MDDTFCNGIPIFAGIRPDREHCTRPKGHRGPHSWQLGYLVAVIPNAPRNDGADAALRSGLEPDTCDSAPDSE